MSNGRFEKGVKCEFCGEGGFKTPADLKDHLEDEHVRANVEFGGRCEDFPCCGHPLGDCPMFSYESGYLPYPCLGCGKRIKRGSRDDAGSSYCSRCLDTGSFACTCGDPEEGGRCEYHESLREYERDLDEDIDENDEK